MKKLMFVASAAALWGCATPTSEVVALPDGHHKVTRQASSAGLSTNSLRASATQAATDFCAKAGKPLRVTDTKETRAGLLGGASGVEVVFRCG